MRKDAVQLFVTPKPVVPSSFSRKQAVLVYLTAGALGAWIFVFLMRRYLGLGTTYDLFLNVQLATSWLQGRFLQENLFGNYLSVHTYFLSPVMAIFVYPFGAPGLLLVAGLAVSAGVVAMLKILRLLGVSMGVAWAFAVIATVMPLSLQVYQVDFYGFQMELLIPSLALWLAYFLLQRRWVESLLCGLALQALKENAVFILVPVAATVLCEDLMRFRAGDARLRWRRALNAPALTVAMFSVLVTPLLLHIVQSQPVSDPTAIRSLQKVHTLDGSAVTGFNSLVPYLVANFSSWLRSDTVATWLMAVATGTFGLIILRPHLLVVGLLTTLTAWLIQGDILWSPRFAPSLAFIQLVGCLAFASVWQVVAGRVGRPTGEPRVWLKRVCAGGAILFVGLAVFQQYRLAPATGETYRLAPSLAISPADRQKADRLFARYREAARPEEPVVATEYLYRYLDDRNFFWYHRLKGRPKPEWILWDQQDVSLSALWAILRSNGLGDVNDYKVFDRDGRFLIYRRKSNAEVAREQSAGAPLIAGQAHGAVRMQVRIADGRAGLAEPLLSIGSAGNGALFFFRYLDDSHLVLGMENMGEGVYTSVPIRFDTARTHELELFCGALLAPAEATDPPSLVARRLEDQNLISARFDGRDVLRLLVRQEPLAADQVAVGVNTIKAASAGQKFLGVISEVVRGGRAPADVSGEDLANQSGPVRLLVRLPATAAGVPEPLLVMGEAGEATLGYVRVLPDNRIRVGIEFWGFGAFESEPVIVKDQNLVEVIYAFPGLLSPTDQAEEKELAKEIRVREGARFTVKVDGAVVLDHDHSFSVPHNTSFVIGSNPAGGSWVGSRYTGTILQVTRETPTNSGSSGSGQLAYVPIGAKAAASAPSEICADTSPPSY